MALDSYLSHDELAALHGAYPQDIEVVEKFCSERHFSIVDLDAGAAQWSFPAALGM